MLRVGLLAAAAWIVTVAPAGAQAPAAVDYDRDVRPVLVARCFGCHGPRQAQSGLRLDLRQNALRGGDYGVVIVPGHASESKLIKRLIGSEAGLQMPPTGELPEHEIAILRAWIDAGAEMPGRTSEESLTRRETAPAVQTFIDAIADHDLEAVQRLLKADHTLARATDGTGSSPLMHAAYSGTLGIMQTLLDAGADVTAKNRRQATALHWAMSDPAKAKLLLAGGADVNARTNEGRSPLYTAASLMSGAAVVRLLLEAGADVEATTVLGTTPLFAAVGTNVEVTRLLLAKGANPNATSLAGVTPIMFTRGGDIVAALVEAGADVRARSKRGETGLMDAAARGDLASAKLLLDRGADVNAMDYRGYTALMIGAHYDRDSPDVIRLLLARGANVGVIAEGETATSLAAKRGETTLTEILRKAASASSARH